MSYMSEIATILDGVMEELQDWEDITFTFKDGMLVDARIGHETWDRPDSMYYSADDGGLDADGEWIDWQLTAHHPSEFLTDDYVMREITEAAGAGFTGRIQWATTEIDNLDDPDSPFAWAHAMMVMPDPAE